MNQLMSPFLLWIKFIHGFLFEEVNMKDKKTKQCRRPSEKGFRAEDFS